MKKVFAILLTAGFLAGMSACGGSTPPPAAPEEPQVEEATPCHEQEVGGDEDAAEDVQVEEQVQE